MDLVGFILAFLILAAAVALWLWQRRAEQHRLAQAEKAHRQAVQRIDEEHTARLARLEREREASLRYAHHGLVEDLLPALDALDNARSHAREAGASAVDEGLAMVTRQFEAALTRHGVERVAPERGEAFDPARHEAVQVVEDDELEPGHVSRCHRPGYVQDERVLRAALVDVVRSTSSADEPEAPTDTASEEGSLTADEPEA